MLLRKPVSNGLWKRIKALQLLCPTYFSWYFPSEYFVSPLRSSASTAGSCSAAATAAGYSAINAIFYESIPPRPCLWRNLCKFPQSQRGWTSLDALGRQQGCTEGPEGRIWLLTTVMSDRRETPLSFRVHRELGTGKGCFILGKSWVNQNWGGH